MTRPLTPSLATAVALAAVALLFLVVALGAAASPALAAGTDGGGGCLEDPTLCETEDFDVDDDGVSNLLDNCRDVPNPGQADWNNDRQGDACDDTDGDGAVDATDNCREVANRDQADDDRDGTGNVCDPDWGGEPVARIDWTMPARARDTNGDGVLDMEVMPPLGWAPEAFEVTLDACESTQGTTAIATYVWTIPSLPAPVEATTCKKTITLPEGSYPTRLTVRTTGGQTATTTKDVVVRDRLMVVMGDSYASGEGNPEKNIVYDDDSVVSWPVWADKRCHRSGHAATARAAFTLEKEDPRSSVTYLSKACSGGTIAEGILGPYRGVDPEDPANPVPPQIDKVKQAVGDAKIDDLLLSVGGNDIGFGHIAQACLIGTLGYQCHTDDTVTGDFEEKIAQLPSAYSDLRARIEQDLQAAQVYVAEYPDFTTDARGDQCGSIGQDIGHFMYIDSQESEWAAGTVLRRLNQTVAAQVTTANQEPGGGRWQLVGGINAAWTGASHGHGYCIGDPRYSNPDRWVRTFTESCDQQGPPSGYAFGQAACMANATKGLLHPNRYGQQVAAERHLLLLRANLPSVDAVPPREDGGGGGAGGGGGDTSPGAQQQTSGTSQSPGGGGGQPLTQAAVGAGAGAPSWLVRAGKAQRALKAGALRFTVTPSEACTLSATAKLKKAVLGRLKKAVAAKRTTLKLRLTKKGRRALGKALRRKKTLTVTLGTRCVNASGAAAIQINRLKVRR